MDCNFREAGTLTIDLNALKDNYLLLASQSRDAVCAAAVKANAYGLGVETVSKSLVDVGCKTFFVAFLEEAISIYNNLHASNMGGNVVIYVLNSISAKYYEELVRYSVRPVLNNWNEVKEWGDFCKRKRVPYQAAVHFDTGMNRLGIKHNSLNREKSSLIDSQIISLIMSHYACADVPKNPFNNIQLSRFNEIKSICPDIPASMANSAAILGIKNSHFSLVRPGIGIYGGNPFANQKNPLQSVVSLIAKIIEIKEISIGETVGYGGRWVAKSKSKIAILPLGYADGLQRSLSGDNLNTENYKFAEVFISGFKAPIIGAVSMDLLAIDVTNIPENFAHIGQEVEVFGKNISIDDLASHAGTLAYEILTGMGNRLNRVYMD